MEHMFEKNELELMIQWFDSLFDTHLNFLEIQDKELADKIIKKINKNGGKRKMSKSMNSHFDSLKLQRLVK